MGPNGRRVGLVAASYTQFIQKCCDKFVFEVIFMFTFNNSVRVMHDYYFRIKLRAPHLMASY